MSDEAFDFEGEVEAIHDTGNALKVRASNGDEFWVPHSCIHDDSEVYEMGNTGTLMVSMWFAEKRGWI